MQDAVIETMVELGMTLPEVDSVLDLDDALVLSRKLSQRTQIQQDDGEPHEGEETPAENGQSVNGR